MNVVVDASVAGKWFLPEPHSDEAERLLLLGHMLLAPDIVYAEVTHAILKSIRGSKAVRGSVDTIATVMTRAVRPYPTGPIVGEALAMAIETGRGSVYDTLYVIVAGRLAAPLVTSDRNQMEIARAAKVDAIQLGVDELPKGP